MKYEVFLEEVRKKKAVFLMDYAWHLHRYYFAFQHMKVEVGGVTKPIGHIYGVLKQVMDIKRNYPDSAIVFCRDGVPVRRRTLDPNYKAGRAPLEYDIMQDEEDLLTLCCRVDDVYGAGRGDLEADDIMFSFAKRLEQDTKGLPIYIFSGDNDMLQAVSDRVLVIRKVSRAGQMDIYDAKHVHEKFYGVTPGSLPVFRSITGDKSDNLPGLYRFPRKLAKRICDAVTELEDIENLDIPDLTPAQLRHMLSLKENMDIVRKNHAIMKLEIEDDIAIIETAEERRAVEYVSELGVRTISALFETITA